MEIYKVISTKKGDVRIIEATSREELSERLTGVAQFLLDEEIIKAAADLWGVSPRSIMLISPTGSPELYQLATLDGEVHALRERLTVATEKRNALAAKLHGNMPVSHIGAALGISFTSANKIIKQSNGGSSDMQ